MAVPSKYCRQTVVLATRHDKERLLGRTSRLVLGATISTAFGIDTDTLSTFKGEVERFGTPREVSNLALSLDPATITPAPRVF